MHADLEANGRDRFSTEINGETIHFLDPMPDARKMLSAANYLPADDCILIQILDHGARAIGLDETVDLREHGVETFWAFRSGPNLPLHGG